MKTKVLDYIDFEKVNTLLEGFNKSTGFVTAILDLEGNVLSNSGWRQICTEFHRINPETAKKCKISDTVLANKMGADEKYHFYKCLNGLVDVAVPVIINGEHIANLFSGQFFFEEPDISFFKKQAKEFGFDEKKYLIALEKVPVVSKEKVKTAMDFLLNMTQLISEITFQKLEQTELNEVIKKNECILRLFVEHSPASIAMFDNQMRYLVASHRFLNDYNLGNQDVIGRSHYEIFPEITERWKEIHRRCLAGETMSASNDSFPRADGSTDWVRWEIRPWFESEDRISGIILFSEVITAQIKDRELLRASEEKFRTLIMASSDSVYRMSPDWSVMYELDGRGFIVDTAKPNASWFQEYIPPDDQEPVMTVIQEAIRTRSLFELEHRVWRVDGTFGWTFSRAIPRLDPNNEIFEWFGAASDVTDRKQAEEKLKENYTLLRIAGEKAKLGGWSVNLDENRSYWSDEVASIHEMPAGYSPLVEDGINFYAPEWRDKITEIFTKCAQEGSPYDEEMEIITSNGKRVWVRTIGEAVRDDKGKIVKVQGAFQDITERKLAEEEIRRQLDELQRWHEVTLGREGRVLQLKQEVNELLKQRGEPVRYGSTIPDDLDNEKIT